MESPRGVNEHRGRGQPQFLFAQAAESRFTIAHAPEEFRQFAKECHRASDRSPPLCEANL
jgi:hypothetical protein